MGAAQRWATYLSPGLRPLYALAAERAARDQGVEVELFQAADYAEIAAGRYDLLFVCGLPYVEIVDGLISALTPIAAPVPLGSRYAGRPHYFSDVVVSSASPARRFEDLRGQRWAFNERGSHSGYLVTLRELATRGEGTGFFGEWVDAGYHQRALRMVAAGEVDGAAIDSHLLDVVLTPDAALRAQVRVVASLGPSPIQPLVAAPQVSEEVVRRVRATVLGLGATPAERQVMAEMRVERFVAVGDADYDGIRRQLEQVKMAGLWTSPRPPGLD